MKTLRHSMKLLTLAVTGLIGLSASAAAAEPWDGNGDYLQGRRTPAYTAWEVVDSDPNGLNCRMAPRYRPALFEAQNTESTAIENYTYNFANWSVLVKIPTGTRLTAPLVGRAGELQTILLDVEGRPWLALNTYLGACLVRANSRYVQPVPASRFQFPN